MMYHTQDGYLFLDPITNNVIKKVQQPSGKDHAKAIYLVDCLPDSAVEGIRKRKFDRVECTAWVKFIFFFLFFAAAITLLSVFYAHLLTALAWAFTVCWVVGPIAIWGMIFQFNLARAAKKLKVLEESHGQVIYQYCLFRLTTKEVDKPKER